MTNSAKLTKTWEVLNVIMTHHQTSPHYVISLLIGRELPFGLGLGLEGL